jgi:hypothetical protein
MKDFKFFKGTLNMIDDDVRATASFNDDTPEGYMNRRMLYHTDRNLYDRLRGSYEIPRGRFGTPERHQDIIRRLQMTNEQRDLINTDNQRGFFQPTSVTKVNPKWWMKIKIVLQESWLCDPIGVVVASALTTIVTIIGIAKLLNAW